MHSKWPVKMLVAARMDFCEPVFCIKNSCVFCKPYLQTTALPRNPHAQSPVNK